MALKPPPSIGTAAGPPSEVGTFMIAEASLVMIEEHTMAKAPPSIASMRVTTSPEMSEADDAGTPGPEGATMISTIE